MRTSTFYAAAMANLGVEVAAVPKRPVVTVVTKKGRRAIENAAEIAAALRARFIGVDVNLLDGNSLSAISVKARVRPCSVASCCWRPSIRCWSNPCCFFGTASKTSLPQEETSSTPCSVP